MRIYIEEASQYVGQEVQIAGWLYNKRSSGKIRFLIIRDGTGLLQCVAFKGNLPEEQFTLTDELTQECSLIITGTISEEPRAPGGYELQAANIELVGRSENYPITPKEHGIDFLLDRRHLWFRSKRQHAIIRIRHEIIMAIRNYFDSRGFVLLDAPIFTPNAVEGTTTLFETEYFGTKAFLTQSGQLYQEAGCMAFGKTYCFGPTFRAEKSKTRRHLTEFWMIEPEVAFMNLDEDMDMMEDLIVEIVARVLDRRQEELKTLERDISLLERIQKPFPRITYDQAAKILTEQGADFQYGTDFGGTDETVVADQFDRPVMIHRWPHEIKAFYMKRDPDDPTKALGVDMLAPEGHGEIIGGAQREDDLDELEKRIAEHNLPKEYFEWYLDLRRYGTVPHAGFGLGLERTVGWICGTKHVRETIPFPRMMHRLEP
ncbi:MAG: asparagine--tRNA ligase [Candidatus Electryoneaceae bacterium]|nr:asparagine--tRNA ligase [Candidatus Electryoneaceae bacterium]